MAKKLVSIGFISFFLKLEIYHNSNLSWSIHVCTCSLYWYCKFDYTQHTWISALTYTWITTTYIWLWFNLLLFHKICKYILVIKVTFTVIAWHCLVQAVYLFDIKLVSRSFSFCRHRDRNNALYENLGLVSGGFVGGTGWGGFLSAVGGREICNNQRNPESL